MGVLEIVLLVAGVGIFILSFILPKKAEEASEETKSLIKQEIKTMVSLELEAIKSHVDDVVEESIEYAVEKTERSLERLTNEKIMAVNEYSETVLKEIHKNHDEAIFLYDMLNSKHNNLKDTVSKVDKTVKEAAETTREVEAAVSNFQKFLPNESAEATAVIAESDKKASESFRIPVIKTVHEDTFVQTVESSSDIVVEPVNDDAGSVLEKGTTGQNNNDKILALYGQGKSHVAIAQELGLGVGEVMLVIDLYKNM